MTNELIVLCKLKYGERWWLGLADDISHLSGASLRRVQRTTLRWKSGDSDPGPVGMAFIKLLSAIDERV
jgi:hypothetical protein